MNVGARGDKYYLGLVPLHDITSGLCHILDYTTHMPIIHSSLFDVTWQWHVHYSIDTVIKCNANMKHPLCVLVEEQGIGTNSNPYQPSPICSSGAESPTVLCLSTNKPILSAVREVDSNWLSVVENLDTHIIKEQYACLTRGKRYCICTNSIAKNISWILSTTKTLQMTNYNTTNN